MLVSSSNEKKSALAKFTNYGFKLEKITESKDDTWGLKARNKEQTFAMNLLRESEIPIVTLVGKAGCGKTLLAIAAGLDQVLEQKKYKTFCGELFVLLLVGQKHENRDRNVFQTPKWRLN